MRANVGDRVLIRGRVVGMPQRSGEIIGVRGNAEEPLLVVRYDDGHDGILVPGSDCEIRHAAESG